MKAVPFAAFFLSGASGLIFETLWARMLQHVFGTTVAAQSTVLTAFMAGLGLGAWLCGRFVDRLRRPILGYALAEVGVALWALLLPELVRPDGWLADVNAALRIAAGSDSSLFFLGRFLCVAPLLLLPAMLMGATLPLLSRHLVGPGERGDLASARVGRLYAANTLGAVAGAFAAGFVLLPAIGLAAANLTAAGLNVALAAGIWLLRRPLLGAARPASPAASPPPAEPGAAPFSRAARALAVVSLVASGAAALSYEVIWSRALAIVLGSSIYAFTLILMTFLAGLGAGSAAAAFFLGRARRPLRRAGLGIAVAGAVAIALVGALVDPNLRGIALTACAGVLGILALLGSLRRRPVLLLGLVQIFIGAATVASALWVDEIPVAFAAVVAAADAGSDVNRVQAFMFLATGLCLVPAALGMGAMLPIALRVFTGGGARIGREVAALYAANTLGAIAGAWLPAFLLVPALGLERTLHGAVALNGVIGLAALGGWATLGDLGSPRRALRTALALGASAIVLVGAALYGWLWSSPDSSLRWDLARMTLGVFRPKVAEVARRGAPAGREILYYRDGLSASVSVERIAGALALRINGKVDASTAGDMATQVLVGALPLLTHAAEPRDLDVAVIGFGSGVTAGTVLRFPVRSVEVIELERAVVEASRLFAGVNRLPYPLARFPYVEAPRLAVTNDDARNHLASTEKRYDVIISEPSNPWVAGVADLFTRDHFRAAKTRLRERGVYAQWVQLYELGPRSIKAIFRTFASEFRHVLVFAPEVPTTDTVILGSDSPLPLDAARLSRRFAIPGAAEELRRAGVLVPFDLFARILFASRDEVLRYAEIERRRARGWRGDPGSINEGPCPPAECRREPAPLNTDDNALIEIAGPREIIGSRRFESHLAKLFSPQWPYGRLSDRIVGAGDGDGAARTWAEVSMALVAHGRVAEAAAFLSRSERAGRAPEAAVAREMLLLLGGAPAEPPGDAE